MMQTRQIEVAGEVLNYAEYPGSGIPLLLMGGIGMALDSLQKPARAFADQGLRCMSLELPAARGLRPLRLRDYADLLAEWLGLVGIERLPVMGVSWGGALAQEFVRRHPGRVSHLVLVSTTPGMAMLPGQAKALFGFLSPGLYRAPREKSGRERVHLDVSKAGWQMLAAAGWTSIHWLHRIKQPALVINGTRDTLVRPANARILAARLPNAQLELIKGAGHLCAYSQAPEVARRVKLFLDSNAPGGGGQTTQ